MNKLLSTTAAALLLTSLFAVPQANAANSLPTKIKAPALQGNGEKIKFQAGSAVQGLQQSDLESLQPQALANLNKFQTPQNSLTAQGTNNTPDTAIPISLNAVNGSTLTATGEQNWYYVYVPDAGKLTVYMQTVASSSVDYDLHLYRLNLNTGYLENQLDSTYGPGTNEQIATLSQEGYYFICINSYQGFDANNPYAFIATQSYGVDAAEPDDNIWQARSKSGDFTVNQTLDNPFDADWIKYTVPKNTLYQFTFNNVPSASNYRLDVFNSSLSYLGSVFKNTTPNVTLGAGTYYFRVATLDTVDPTANYKLQVRKLASAEAPASISVSSIASTSGYDGYINYGYGYFWRVKGFMTVNGVVKDQYGEAVGNAPLTMAIQPAIQSQPIVVNSSADTNGTFALTASLPPGVGAYSYYAAASTHYYDIIPMAIATSNNVTYSTNLYHFAYSIYHPF